MIIISAVVVVVVVVALQEYSFIRHLGIFLLIPIDFIRFDELNRMKNISCFALYNSNCRNERMNE
ncbi:hypothetical protein DERF_010452 [Dermatophagoides farinae]|uniref:Uncharacterized protein n=1 Tax=Dermatophagoides farinae TaxID=6954 RepID=A0A922HZ07_DERFA|nr:hypothetical protein DERF_010452 [Dermatophagoides farinae]